MGSEKLYKNEEGRHVLGRLNRWGLVQVEDPRHCEFHHLRDLLVRWWFFLNFFSKFLINSIDDELMNIDWIAGVACRIWLNWRRRSTTRISGVGASRRWNRWPTSTLLTRVVFNNLEFNKFNIDYNWTLEEELPRRRRRRDFLIVTTERNLFRLSFVSVQTHTNSQAK